MLFVTSVGEFRIFRQIFGSLLGAEYPAMRRDGSWVLLIHASLQW